MHYSLLIGHDLQKEVGAWNFLQLNEGLDGMIAYLFSRELGYSKEEIDVLAAAMRKQIKDPKIHSFFWMYVEPYHFYDLMD